MLFVEQLRAEELRQGHPETVRYSLKVHKRRVALACLHLGKVRSRHSDAPREALLTQARLRSQFLDAKPRSHLYIQFRHARAFLRQAHIVSDSPI